MLNRKRANQATIQAAPEQIGSVKIIKLDELESAQQALRKSIAEAERLAKDSERLIESGSRSRPSRKSARC